MDESLAQLQEDARTLDNLEGQFDDEITSLEEELAAVMLELEKDQAEVAEVENCDQAYLARLKGEIAEQKFVLPSSSSILSCNITKLFLALWLKALNGTLRKRRRRCSH
jgi:predicted  nucleic acid-binding Zn-ribbon protein